MYVPHYPLPKSHANEKQKQTSAALDQYLEKWCTQLLAMKFEVRTFLPSNLNNANHPRILKSARGYFNCWSTSRPVLLSRTPRSCLRC